MTLDALRGEHGNISRLLLVLESQLSDVHAGDQFDGRLMLEALSYVVDYLDRFHREREDVFVEALARHQPTVRSFLATLSAQRHAIQSDGAQLRGRLVRAVDEKRVDRDDLVREGFAYCTAVRRAMSLEETILAFATAAAEPAPGRGEPVEPSAPGGVESSEDRYGRLFEELTHRIGCECSYVRSS
jgi:hemerythrin-like domain-containing protein